MSVSFSFDHQYMPDELVGEIMSAFADGREVLFDSQIQVVIEMEDGDFSFWHLCQEEENCPGRGKNPRSTTSGDLSFEKPGSSQLIPSSSGCYLAR